MDFCNPFDRSLALTGPAAVFLRDRHGKLRFDETWSRDAWGREPGPHAAGDTWLLLRDRDTGFVHLVLCTSPTLLAEHPRCDVRVCASEEDAWEALQRFGNPPMAHEAW